MHLVIAKILALGVVNCLGTENGTPANWLNGMGVWLVGYRQSPGGVCAHLEMNWSVPSMKIVAITCRIFLGLLFVVFGANGLHPFMPMQMPPPGPVLDWMTVMMNSHWLQVISFFELLGGLLVLAGGTLPLGLCILCPITINIWCFHMLLAGGHGTGPAIFATVLELILIYSYRASFGTILSAKQKPV